MSICFWEILIFKDPELKFSNYLLHLIHNDDFLWLSSLFIHFTLKTFSFNKLTIGNFILP